MKKYIILFITCLLLSVNLFGENEFSFRLAPSIEAPLTIPEFSTGMGAAVSLDWGFRTKVISQFADGFNLGVSAGGSFLSLPFEAGDPFTLMGGKLGPFLRYRPRIKDTNDRWAFRAGLNGGVYQYIRAGESDTNFLFSFGLGAEFYLSPYFSLFADGEYTYRVFSERSGNAQPLDSLGAAVGIRLNLSEIMGGRSRVRVEKTEQYRVFPVSYAWYENNPVAMITVTNEEPNAITDIQLSFFMDSFMSQPWTFAVLPRLAFGVSVEVPVTALFNEAMMNLTETINANGLLQLEYRSLGARRNTTAAIQMPIFHRNTLSWDDDRRAAAFVSPYDFAALFFARYVESAVNSNLQLGEQGTGNRFRNTPSNVLYAAALFEALRLYGITYVVVPATSFANVSADESVLDNVSFPYQALYYRGGDCSYLSILFCSMLEALGIESAFITIPGHIYIAFEVGDDNWRLNSEDIIELEIDGVRKRWLPVEITIPNEGFARAWRVGGRQWRNAVNRELRTEGLETGNSAEGAKLYPIRDAWKIYPSVTVPASGAHLPEMPEWDAIIRAVERELAR
jgi:transglutaminase-like putative cysteine protease